MIKKLRGNVFYRVEYQGKLTKIVIVGSNERGEIYENYPMTKFLGSADKWELRDKVVKFGTQNFPLSHVLNNKEYYEVLEDAIVESKRRFEIEVYPNATYCVYKAFDDVVESKIDSGLSKKEAIVLVNRLNSDARRHGKVLTSYYTAKDLK